VKSLDLTLKRTLSSFSRGPTLHLRTVQRFASHPSSSASNSASDLFLLDSASELARDLCSCSRINGGNEIFPENIGGNYREI
jgi:hypothetical protein